MNPVSAGQSGCASRLAAGASVLKPVLEPEGFTFKPADTGSASAGPFATGFFKRDLLSIGLIVRESGMGGVSYEQGDLMAGHDDLLRALGAATGRLVFDRDEWRSISRFGGDPFEALAVDLSELVVPVLSAEPERFHIALSKAHAARMRSLGFAPADAT